MLLVFYYINQMRINLAAFIGFLQHKETVPKSITIQGIYMPDTYNVPDANNRLLSSTLHDPYEKNSMIPQLVTEYTL